MFLVAAAALQACKDAHLTDEQLRALAAAHQHPHAAFDQAARMEHQRERQIIEQQHREAEEAAARLRQQVDAMQPAMEWYGAPPEVPLDPAWQVSSGWGLVLLAVCSVSRGEGTASLVVGLCALPACGFRGVDALCSCQCAGEADAAQHGVVWGDT